MAEETQGNATRWLNWMSQNLYLVDKANCKVPFIPNRIQADVLGHMFAQWKRQCPVRLIILKPRQVGTSTAIQSLYYTICHHTPHMNAFVAAHNEKASGIVFGKAKFYHENLPKGIRKPTKYDRIDTLSWAAPHGSLFTVQPAITTVGTGGTYQLVHISEYAKWATQKVSMASLVATVPKPGKTHKTAIVIESTANGEGDDFHYRWKDAVAYREKHPDDYNCFLPLFYSWIEFPEEYSMPVEKWYRWGSFSAEEEELMAIYGATKEQLRWRRYTIKEEYSGSLELFHQEFPHNPRVAFISSGDHAIPAYIREYHHTTAKEPMYARLSCTGSDKSQVSFTRCDYDPNGCWRIFKEPKPMRDYALGADVAEGVPVDPDDPHGKRDRSAISVIDRELLELVALYVGMIDPDLFGEELIKAGYYYNHGWICPEVNNAGQSALDAIRRVNYRRLYARKTDPDAIEQRTRNLLGWRTTSTNRDYLIDKYLEMCRKDFDNPDIGFSYSFTNLSSELAEEEDTFIRTKTGKREHRGGCWDDVLFSVMIAAEVHRRCPREFDRVKYAESFADVRLGPEFVGGTMNGTFGTGRTTVMETG